MSNFTVALLDEANRVSPEPLVCNQVECHPYLDQDKVIAACRKHGMAVVAYSPIARGRAKGDKVLERIGETHGKSAAQVCLRWLTQQGIVVIPRTSKLAAAGGELRDLRFRIVGRRNEGNRRARPPRRPHRRLDLVAEVGLTRACRHRRAVMAIA